MQRLVAQGVAQGGVQDGLPPAQRFWAIATIVIAVGMSSLDGSIANTALPTIAADLNASPATSIWVVNAYQLTLGRDAAAVRFAGRDLRLSARLYLRPCGVHRGVAAVRAVMVAADIDRGAGAAGLRRQRLDERQHGTDPLHLSGPLARPRRRVQCAGGRGVHRRRAECGGGDPFGGVLALSVRDQRAAGGAGAGLRNASVAGDAARHRIASTWAAPCSTPPVSDC